MATVRSLDVAVRANTQNFETGMRKVSQGLRATIVGMNAVAAAASGQEKSVIGMINAVAIGFATGGPWGAAIAAAGVGIGTLIGRMKEMGTAWDETLKAMAAESKKFGDASAKTFRDLSEELTGRPSVLLDLDMLRSKRDSFQAQRRPGWTGFGSKDLAENIRKGTQEADDAISSLLNNEGMLAALRAKRLRDEMSLLETDEKLRDVLAVQLEYDREIAKWRMLQAEGVQIPADMFGNLEKLRDMKIGAAFDDMEEKVEKVGAAAQIAARSVSDFLSAVIVRGAEAKDVLMSLAQSLLSMGIQRGVNSAFGIATP